MDNEKDDFSEGFMAGGSTQDSVVDNPMQIDALGEEGGEELEEENLEYSSLVQYVESSFQKAKTKRLSDETRWLECYRNYRGLYGPDVAFRDDEKSRAFMKITKTKVLASYSKITEVLFSGSKFPIGVEATPVPEGIPESITVDPKDAQLKKKSQADKIPSTYTRKEIFDKLNPQLVSQLEKLPEEYEIKEGAGTTPTSVNWEPARAAAKKMEKKIHDQLEESDADKALRSFAFECVLFGSGIIKGPLATTKEYPRWDKNGNYSPEFNTVADISFTSIWNNYPDPDARSATDYEFWIERHRMSKSQLRKLKRRPFFRKESVELAIDYGPNYQNEYWEDILRDNTQTDTSSETRFEVLEYWGFVDQEFVEETEFADELPEKYKDLDQFSVNIWVCNGQLLRLVLNPFNPARIPYYICPYEANPYSLFGIGVAENMMDTQLIMNGFMRLAIDNAVLSSNVVFEVDETNLAPGQDMKVYPGKVFRRQSGAPGQAIFATKYPNVTQECMLMFDKARQLADESTGIPSYAHGISGIMSTGRTAAGMSMLMGAADENIKAVVRNIDDYLLHPLGKALFAFNMQFNFDPEIQGDLSIVAKGTESLMRGEIRGQKLMQMLQLTTNQMDAPFVKRDYILRELAEALDLDPDKIVNSKNEAMIQAALMKDMAQAMGAPDGMQPQAGGSNVAGLPTPNENAGEVKNEPAPIPGAQGFSGSQQSMPTQEPTQQ